ncbi:MAG: caspase family protein [Planctomycetota bacterium]
MVGRLTLAVLALLVAGPTHAITRHALVVGVNAVPDFRIGPVRVRPLRGAEYDAEEFADTLVEHWGFTERGVTLLVGHAATHDRVETELSRIERDAAAGDSVVFYFAGHGTQAPDAPPLDEPADEGLDEALCLSDANAQGENLLVDDRLAAWIRRLKAKRIAVILDCCHSGTGAKGPADQPVARGISLPLAMASATDASSPSWAELDRVSKSTDKQVVALYACDSGQSAYERRFAKPAGQPMGQFTRFLLEALRDPTVADDDRDGRLSVREANGYVARRIDAVFNAGRPPKRQQTPRHDAARDRWEVLVAPTTEAG